MSTIKRFEDLIAWQKTRTFNQGIYKVSSEGRFAGDFSLKDQIRRASISILSNIAVGFERNGNKEFVHYLSIAKASNAEVRSQLYIASDLNYLDKKIFNELISQSEEIGKIINGLIQCMQSSDYRGSKFKEQDLTYVTISETN